MVRRPVAITLTFVPPTSTTRTFTSVPWPSPGDPTRGPAAAREVRELDGRAAFRDGHLGEREGRAPRGRVVDVVVRSQSLAHRLHQPVRHDEVHAAVTALLACKLTDVG